MLGFIKGGTGQCSNFICRLNPLITEENKVIPILPPCCTSGFVNNPVTETLCVLLQVPGRLFCAAN